MNHRGTENTEKNNHEIEQAMTRSFYRCASLAISFRAFALSCFRDPSASAATTLPGHSASGETLKSITAQSGSLATCGR
jgi:hypothetical protein